MDFLSDLSVFFSDFTDPITIDGRPVLALLDVELATAFGLVGGQETLIQVPYGTSVVRHSLVSVPFDCRNRSIAGKTYKVTRTPHDEHGVLTLELTEQ